MFNAMNNKEYLDEKIAETNENFNQLKAIVEEMLPLVGEDAHRGIGRHIVLNIAVSYKRYQQDIAKC